MAFLTKRETASPDWVEALGQPHTREIVYSAGNKPVPYDKSLGYVRQTIRSPRLARILGQNASQTYGLGAQGRQALDTAGKVGLVGAGVLGAGLAGKAAYDAYSSDPDKAKYAHNIPYVYFSAAGRI